MDSAIKRAEDTWWDMDNHCIVTKADNELDQIMDQDQDLFFLDRAMEVDMSNTDTSNKPKTQVDLTSTRSISTFQKKNSVYCVITKYSRSYIKDLHGGHTYKMGQVVVEARCGGFRYMWGIA